MLFGKRGKSGLVALNLDFAQVVDFVKERLGKEVFDLHIVSSMHKFLMCVLYLMILIFIRIENLAYVFRSFGVTG